MDELQIIQSKIYVIRRSGGQVIDLSLRELHILLCLCTNNAPNGAKWSLKGGFTREKFLFLR